MDNNMQPKSAKLEVLKSISQLMDQLLAKGMKPGEEAHGKPAVMAIEATAAKPGEEGGSNPLEALHASNATPSEDESPEDEAMLEKLKEMYEKLSC